MHGLRILRVAALSAVLTGPAASIALAQAANGPFDGEWVVDVPPSPVISRTSESTCPALRLPVRIEGGHVVGELTRMPASSGEMVIEAGEGPDAAPVIGEVQPDGTVHASWENYQATGRLSGGAGQITIETSCGPEVATATRLSQ